MSIDTAETLILSQNLSIQIIFVQAPIIHKITFVTVHDKTRYKSEIVIVDNAHLKVQTLCYFMLKSDLSNRDKITSV